MHSDPINGDPDQYATSIAKPANAIRVLGPLGMAVCLSLFGDLALYASLVTQLDTLGINLGAVGIVLSIHRLIRIPGNLLAGLLLDHSRRRPPFILGMLLATVSTAAYAGIYGLWPLLLSRLAWGLAWTLINVGGMAMTLDISTLTNRGQRVGIYNTWMLLGLASGPLVGGVLVDALGFRPAMLTCAGITCVGLIIAGGALPETAPHLTHTSNSGFNLSYSRTLLKLGRHKIKPWLHRNRSLLLPALLYMVTQFAGDGIALSTTSLLLQRHFGESVMVGHLSLGIASAGGILLALRSLVASAVGPLAGRWSDRQMGRWPIILGSLIIGIGSFSVLAFATSLWSITLGTLLGAISTGTALATLAAQVGDLTPDGKQGLALGLYAAAGDIGSTAAPLASFMLLPRVDLRWIYIFCALAFLSGLILSWRHAQSFNVRR